MQINKANKLMTGIQYVFHEFLIKFILVDKKEL